MKSKKKQIPEEKKLFSNKRLAILTVVLVAVIVSGFLLFRLFTQAPEVAFSFKAAIIDQVGEDLPSSPSSAHKFNETVTNLLENAGFNVSYHKSESITVNFYKELAKDNYGIIILRAHSALREGETLVDFFTSEEYEEDNTYTDVTKGNYSWQPGKFYFAITPKFIENLEGYFPKSIIIAMGCWSLKPNYEEMADAFIKKGARAYIGWTDSIGLSYSDNSTIKFLQDLVNNKTISYAINHCNQIHDPEFPGILSYYPSGIGNYRLSDFTAEANLSSLFLAILPRLLARNKKLYYFRIAA
jgi:hypothetical protein